MTRLVALAALLAPLVACGTSADVEALEKRVNMLERRVRTLENGGGPTRGKAKGKARPTATRIPQGEGKGTVQVTGDATTVTLVAGDNTRHPVPGKVTEGDYAIFAVFPEAGDTKAGSITVVDGEVHALVCDAATGRCAEG